MRAKIFLILAASGWLAGCACHETSPPLAAGTIPIVQEPQTIGQPVVKSVASKKVKRARSYKRTAAASSSRKTYAARPRARKAVARSSGSAEASSKAINEANMRFMDEYLGTPQVEPPRLQ